jgi:carbon starvation protein
MNILIPLGVAAILFLVAFRYYPPYIARVFKEDDRNPPPSQRYADGRDYVKSRSHVVFAQHFATIAGAGPIVGPTLALAFGWQPVWLWVVFGGIFFGAVHDMSSMFASVREGGRTIGEIARRALGPVGYVLTLAVFIFVLTIVNAIFLNLSVVALTSLYPLDALDLPSTQTLLGTVVDGGVVKAHIGGIATTSVFIITGFAPMLGWLIRRDRISTRLAYVVALAIAVASVVLGFVWPVSISGDAWRDIMTGYILLACALPVWLILQPRDFTNVQILYGGIALLFVSALIAGFSGLHLSAPSLDLAAGEEAAKGPVWPILFITVACGAISGFHSLVSSGTTVKQIPRESDCRRIGYGAMLVESFLALLVLTAVASMMPQQEYLRLVYPTGSTASNPVLAFALSGGRLINLALPFVPVAIATVFGILMIEGFVVTTLDTSVRLCRYLFDEFWLFAFAGHPPTLMRNPVFDTVLAVGLMLFFALSSTVRQMWPVFGAGNQLIGALALTTVSVWLIQRGRRYRFALIPAIFMIATTLAALWLLVRSNLASGNGILALTAGGLMFLSIGVVVVGVARFAQALQSPAQPMEVATP